MQLRNTIWVISMKCELKVFLVPAFFAFVAVPLQAQELNCTNLLSNEFFRTATSDTVQECIKNQDENQPLVALIDRYGRTPLHFAAASAASADVIAALIAAEADPNSKSIFDWTPLHFAARYSAASADVIDVLIAAEADPTLEDVDGLTPLHFAAASAASAASADVIAALIAAEADPNSKSILGLTPLHFAAANAINSTDVIDVLIIAEADPNLRDLDGLMPLDFVSARASADVIDALKSAPSL